MLFTSSGWPWDLVNRDYEKFVSLTTDLVDVDAAVEDWEAPIAAFKEEAGDGGSPPYPPTSPPYSQQQLN